MHPAITEAIANADAQLNNAGMPTYTEAIEALKSAKHTLTILENMERISKDSIGMKDLMKVLNRINNEEKAMQSILSLTTG